MKEVHRYKEFNDFTGKSQKGRKHSVKFKEVSETTQKVVKTIKVATVVSVFGVAVATADLQMQEPLFDMSDMKVYMQEAPNWHPGSSFDKLIAIAEGHVHDWDSGTVIEASTCTSKGSMEYKCKGCGETKREITDFGEHTIVYDEAKEVTCTEDGLTAEGKCSVCGKIIEAAEVITAKGHVPIVVKAKEATCTERGHTDGEICEVCGEGLVNTTVTEALGHLFGEEVVTQYGSCTTDGIYTKTCSRCGETENRVVTGGGHTPESMASSPATCEGSGSSGGTRCSTCGEILSAPDTIAPLGHLTYEGSIKCERCGKNLCDHIDIMVAEDSWDANCSETGHIAEVRCATCGEVISEGYDTPIDPNAHAFETIYAEGSATELGRKCYLCGHTEYYEEPISPE